MKRPRSLQVLFAELNRSHFDGRLSTYTVRRTCVTLNSVKRLTRGGAVHRFRWTRPWARQIRVVGVLQRRPRIERRVLHEMCHAAAEAEAIFRGEPHGQEWRVEMYRLAREHGEAWAEQEARRHEPQAVPVTEMLE